MDGIHSGEVIQLWNDNSNERPGFIRAFWVKHVGHHIGCPVIGYCSPGGSYSRAGQVAWEARRLYPGVKIYDRSGRLMKI